MKTDVLICGAGPVGLSLAVECARHGVSFLLIEKTTQRESFSKALGIWNNTLEVFDAMGVVDTILKKARRVDSLQFYCEGKACPPIRIENVPSRFPFPVFLPQSETEAILETKLEALGGNVLRGHELLSFEESPKGVRARVLEKGKEKTIEALWIAGCDGPHSAVRHQMQIPFEGYTEPENFALCDAEFEGTFPTHSVNFHLGVSGILGLIPLSDKVLRVITKKDPSSTAREPTLHEIQKVLDHEGVQNLTLKNPHWLSYFTVNERIARNFVQGRAFLLGDAAHIHSPTGGQGMNTGIQDAYNLGWKLKFLINNPNSSSAICASYQEERHPVAVEVIKRTSRLLHFIVKESYWRRLLKKLLLQTLPRFSFTRKKLVYTFSGLGIRYRKSPLIEPGAPGTKLRDFPIVPQIGGKMTTTHRLAATGAHLLLLPSPSAKERFFSPRETVLCYFFESPQQKTFPLKQDEWLFIRPDLYIAATGKVGDWKPIERYLDKLC